MILPTKLSEEKEKEHVPDDPEPKASSSEMSSNKKTREEEKLSERKGKKTCQSHHRATILIRLMTVIADARYIKRRAIKTIV